MAEIRSGSVGEEHALTKLASSSPLAPEPEEESGDDQSAENEEGEAA
jgi:hypothetical protein